MEALPFHQFSISKKPLRELVSLNIPLDPGSGISGGVLATCGHQNQEALAGTPPFRWPKLGSCAEIQEKNKNLSQVISFEGFMWNCQSRRHPLFDFTSIYGPFGVFLSILLLPNREFFDR